MYNKTSLVVKHYNVLDFQEMPSSSVLAQC